jgi:hypothetical protein
MLRVLVATMRADVAGGDRRGRASRSGGGAGERSRGSPHGEVTMKLRSARVRHDRYGVLEAGQADRQVADGGSDRRLLGRGIRHRFARPRAGTLRPGRRSDGRDLPDGVRAGPAADGLDRLGSAQHGRVNAAGAGRRGTAAGRSGSGRVDRRGALVAVDGGARAIPRRRDIRAADRRRARVRRGHARLRVDRAAVGRSAGRPRVSRTRAVGMPTTPVRTRSCIARTRSSAVFSTRWWARR